MFKKKGNSIYFIKNKFNFITKKYNKEVCSLASYFYFFTKEKISISFSFWNILSYYIAMKINEKFISLVKILKRSKLLWIKRCFSLEKTVQLDHKKIPLITTIINCTFNKFLNILGPTFFTKFLDNITNVLLKLFTHYKDNRKSNLNKKLIELVRIYFCNNCHFSKSYCFLSINIKSLIITDIWVIYSNVKKKKIPWWRRLKIRECEIEYASNQIVRNICINFNRKKI
jgi:hypothetical protein